MFTCKSELCKNNKWNELEFSLYYECHNYAQY